MPSSRRSQQRDVPRLRLIPPFVRAVPELTGDRPDFPLHVLPEAVRGIVRNVARLNQVLKDLVAMPLLTVAASAIGASRVLQIKTTWNEPAMLWTCVIGRTGTGKTPAIGFAMRPVHDEQQRLDAAPTDLPHWRTPRERQDEDLDPPSITTTDTTIEGLIRQLRRNPRGLLLDIDEMAGWLQGLSRGATQPAQTQYLSIWSMKRIQQLRASKGKRTTIASHPCVNIIGGVQPQVLRRCGLEKFEDGLLQRMLFIYPRHDEFAGHPGADIPPRLIQAWTDVYNKLRTLPLAEDHRTPLPIPLSAQAHRCYDLFAARLKEVIDAGYWPESMRPFAAKLRAHVLRFALVLHYLRWACDEEPECQTIAAEDVFQGCALGWFVAEHHYATLSLLRANKDEDDVGALIDWLARQSRSSSTAREAQRAEVAGKHTTEEVVALFRAAEARGIGQVTQHGKTITFRRS